MAPLPRKPLLCLALALLAMPLRAALPDGVAEQLRSAAAKSTPGIRRVEVVLGDIDPRLKLAPCARIEPVIPPTLRPWGRFRVTLRCVEGARWQVHVPVQVKVIGPGWVAARSLPAGATVTQEDLRPADIDWAADPQGMVRDAAVAHGRTLARPLAAGAALAHADLRARQWFGAGDTVQVVATGRGFAVLGVGEAVSPGIEGQAARVRVEGGRLLTGRPIGDRRIEVAL